MHNHNQQERGALSGSSEQDAGWFSALDVDHIGYPNYVESTDV